MTETEQQALGTFLQPGEIAKTTSRDSNKGRKLGTHGGGFWLVGNPLIYKFAGNGYAPVIMAVTAALAE